MRVKVLEADPERKRISLTLRLDDEPAPSGGRPAAAGGRQGSSAARKGSDAGQSRKDAPQPRKDARPARNDRTDAKRTPPPKPAPVNTAMAEALRKAGLGK